VHEPSAILVRDILDILCIVEPVTLMIGCWFDDYFDIDLFELFKFCSIFLFL
jgi:hypothetical protein